MEPLNIIDYKSKLDSLSSDILNKYKELETSYIDLQNSKNIELASINSKNISLYELVKEKESIITSLENEILRYKNREAEYKLTIENQKLQKVEDENTNKFDMLRSQAKEITCKDKEIERLTKELTKQKELNSIKNNIEVKVDHGWSPTSSKQPTMEPDKLVLDDNDINHETANDETANDETANDETANDETIEEQSEELYIVKYRKKKYYRDKDNNVYHILDDDEKGDLIGVWTLQDNGKHKLVKN